MKKNKFQFDLCYTSLLKRAMRTLGLALEEMDLLHLPVIKDWRLNERHYGDLQGKNKAETLKKFGEEKFMLWRRSYDVRPPAIKPNAKYSQVGDIRYRDIKVPLAECLQDVVKRVVPYWEKTIAPQVKKGKSVLIAASGNSLRALAMHLDKLSKDEVMKLNIPTGTPLVYELDKNLKPLKHYYLGDKKEIQALINMVANQGKR